MSKHLIVCHIRTSNGARFSIHPDEEDLRKELVQYYNEVHADSDNPALEEEASLDDAIDAIEEMEDVSWEEITLDPQEFWK